MEATLTIPGRCNGPPYSANGGYTCGLLAGLLGHDGGAVEVALRAPPPLERSLSLRRDRGRVTACDGHTLIAEARPAELNLEVPASPGFREAERASALDRDQWFDGHPFPTCVVCGPERDRGDGLRLFPGRIPGSELFGAPWTPDPSVAKGDGEIGAPWVWAALDCPSSAPVLASKGRTPCLLAALKARLHGSVGLGESYLVVSWLQARDGRKHRSASALFDRSDELRGVASALWIELQPSDESLVTQSTPRRSRTGPRGEANPELPRHQSLGIYP